MAAEQVLTIEEFESLNPRANVDYHEHSLIYCTPNTMTMWRVKTLFDKEPVTIDWLQGIEPGEVLVDVGANVGMYTIFAAVVSKAKVFAFEPESQNFALLIKNIWENQVSNLVTAWPAALSDTQGVSKIYIAKFGVGYSANSYGEQVDPNLEHFEPAMAQGSIALTLDQLVADGVVEVPNHIKIDVDGFEHKVISGARTVLSNTGLKTILVEINQRLDEHMAIIGTLADYGFKFDPEQVKRAERKDGIFEGLAEYVFRR